MTAPQCTRCRRPTCERFRLCAECREDRRTLATTRRNSGLCAGCGNQTDMSRCVRCTVARRTRRRRSQRENVYAAQLGTALRIARQLGRYTLGDVARAVGTDPCEVSRMEKGDAVDGLFTDVARWLDEQRMAQPRKGAAR